MAKYTSLPTSLPPYLSLKCFCCERVREIQETRVLIDEITSLYGGKNLHEKYSTKKFVYLKLVNFLLFTFDTLLDFQKFSDTLSDFQRYPKIQAGVIYSFNSGRLITMSMFFFSKILKYLFNHC